MRKFLQICSGILLPVLLAYVAWYSYERQEKIVAVEHCAYNLEHPSPPTMTTAPDGNLAPVYSIETCAAIIAPPSLWDIMRGRMKFEDVPERMKINPYSFVDMLLGRYVLGPDISMPCDQSATTTDCSTPPAPSQPELQPYVAPNTVQPVETWVSATGTPISLFGFSFELPVGLHGAVYKDSYLQTLHALVQSDSSDKGFTIDCPPASKGLEAATRLSSEVRSFTTDGTDYSVAFEKWTAPGNDPWYFLWVRTPQSGDSSNGSSGTYCLAQGTATPDTEKAMRTMYDSWK